MIGFKLQIFSVGSDHSAQPCFHFVSESKQFIFLFNVARNS